MWLGSASVSDEGAKLETPALPLLAPPCVNRQSEAVAPLGTWIDRKAAPCEAISQEHSSREGDTALLPFYLAHRTCSGD